MKLNSLQKTVLERIRNWSKKAPGGVLTDAEMARWPEKFPEKTVHALRQRGAVRSAGLGIVAALVLLLALSGCSLSPPVPPDPDAPPTWGELLRDIGQDLPGMVRTCKEVADDPNDIFWSMHTEFEEGPELPEAELKERALVLCLTRELDRWFEVRERYAHLAGRGALIGLLVDRILGDLEAERALRQD